MLRFIGWKATAGAMAKGTALAGLMVATGFLLLAAPSRATAEVTNRLQVNNNTSSRIDFYINGTLWIQGIPSRGARDCYPSHYGATGDLLLQAFDGNGSLIKQQTQRGRVNNFFWNVP